MITKSGKSAQHLKVRAHDLGPEGSYDRSFDEEVVGKDQALTWFLNAPNCMFHLFMYFLEWQKSVFVFLCAVRSTRRRSKKRELLMHVSRGTGGAQEPKQSTKSLTKHPIIAKSNNMPHWNDYDNLLMLGNVSMCHCSSGSVTPSVNKYRTLASVWAVHREETPGTPVRYSLFVRAPSM